MNDAYGYITVATGHRRYLQMAVDLALSLREFDDKPVALVAGDELRTDANAPLLAQFDRVVSMPPGYPTFLGKFAVPLVTPFERSYFLDADCLAIGPLAPFWPPLEGFDFAAQGRYVGPDEDFPHHQLSTAAMIRHFGLKRYLRHNAGVLYFRRAAGMAVSAAAMRVWEEGFGRAMPFDEPMRAIVAERLGIATMPKPFPMAWYPSDVAPRDPKHRVIHFMGPLRVATLTWLLNEVRRRRQAVGLPWQEGVAAWLRKATMARQEWVPPQLLHLAFHPADAAKSDEPETSGERPT
jgi:hypothetical protein